MIYKKPGSRFWMAKFMWRGKVIRKSTRTTDKKTARAIEAKFRVELAKGDWDLLEKKPLPTLGEFLEGEFLKFVRTKSSTKPKTVAYYEYGVKNLRAASFSSVKLDEVTDQHAAMFAAANSSLSPSTINNGLRTLRRALSLAVEWRKLNRRPKITLAKGERHRERVLSERERDLYLSQCRQPWKDVATVILGTGMRPGEVYCLRWENVLLDSECGYLRVTEGKTKAAKRLLPMVPEVYRAMMARYDGHKRPVTGWVFPSGASCGHFDENSAKGQHAAALKALEQQAAREKAEGNENPETVQAFEPYCLRHTALTRLAESGCDAFTLAKIAGHSSITITQRYCHPQAEAIERAFSKMVKDSQLVTEGGHPPKQESQQPLSEQVVTDSKETRRLARPERFELPTY